MAGTSAAAVKAALFDRLTAVFASREGMRHVQVSYSLPGNPERECVYGGPVRFTHELAGLGGQGRVPREETITVPVVVHVRTPGATLEDNDARAAEIGTVVEETLSEFPLPFGVPGLMFAAIEEGELDGGLDDEAAISEITYQVSFWSTLG